MDDKCITADYIIKNEWINESMFEWINEWMGKWMNEKMDRWIKDELMNE